MKTQTFRFSRVEKLAAAALIAGSRQEGNMSQTLSRTRWISFLAIGWILLLAPTISRAGVNTWTGGPPSGARLENPTLVATAGTDPYLVYAAYDSDLYRSADGGRTWARVASFDLIYALCVHPTLPSTVYVGALRSGSLAGVFKTEDGGLTWNQTLVRSFDVFVYGFAASPKSPSTLYARTYDQIYKSDNGGDDWVGTMSPALDNGLSQQIAALILDPNGGVAVYAGGDDYSYPDYGPLAPFFRKSTDGGATWVDMSTGLGGGASVEAIAIDPVNPATIFVGLKGSATSSVLRSGDGGASWTPAQSGLPTVADVFSLVMDPGDSSILYAGTDSGVYRSRDGGTSWIAYGQQLRSIPIRSLALDASGRALHAGTDLGVGAFDLEIAAGPLDVSSGAADQDRVLYWDADRLSVRTLDESGNWASTPFEGPFSGWTATAVADGTDGFSRVLWVNGDGRTGLEIVGASGAEAAFRYAAIPLWTATDVAVARDGSASLLWTGVKGQMFVATVDPTGAATLGPQYGPYGGWSALAIAEGPDGSTWVLWRSTDGRAGVSRLRARTLDAAFRFEASPGWAAEDITVAADGRPRLLRLNPDGRASLATIDAQGRLTAEQIYSNPGSEARRIGASSDGLTRLLWTAPDGSGAVWLFNADNTLNSQQLAPIPAPAPNTVSGAWTGTFVPIDFIDCSTSNTPASASFEENGSAVTGTLDTTGSDCGFHNIHFVGTLQGNALTGTINGDRFVSGSMATGQASDMTLDMTLTNMTGFPLAIPGGQMHLHR